MANLKDNSISLIIGGGIQGLETAWILSQMNKQVIISHHSQTLMRKFLDEKSSRILERSIISNGIKILFDTQVSEVIGKDSVEGFKTVVGESYLCDAIMYSIGTKPNVDFLEDTPININRGKVAGYNICGKDTTYDYIIPVTTLNAFGISLFSMGIVDEEKATNLILEDKSDENIYNKVFIKDNKVIGAIVVGSIKSSPTLKSAIEKKTSLEDIDYSNMSFEDFIKVLKDETKKII